MKELARIMEVRVMSVASRRSCHLIAETIRKACRSVYAARYALPLAAVTVMAAQALPAQARYEGGGRRGPDLIAPRAGPDEPGKVDAPFNDYALGAHDVGLDPSRGFGRLFPIARPGARPEPGFLLPQLSQPSRLKALAHLMIETEEDEHRGGDSAMPAGYTFFGQFIDHDITLDTSSKLGQPLIGYRIENGRTPDLDLDSVYAGGPERAPFLYHLPYLRVGRAVSPTRFDLFRLHPSKGPGPEAGGPVALTGDPRNDENFIIAQLHCVFVAFHNRIVDELILKHYGGSGGKYCGRHRRCDPVRIVESLPREEKAKLFEAAHDTTIHFYHRLILEDFLPRLIGLARTRDLYRNGRDFYYPHGFRKEGGGFYYPFIPIEFAVAAYRYGHSQLRGSYQLSLDIRQNLFASPGELRRGRGLVAFQPIPPDALIDWRYFFPIDPVPPENFNWARNIDPLVTWSLHELDRVGAVGQGEIGSLPARNLIRGRVFLLPSGQEMARAVLPALERRGALAFWGGHGREDWRRFLLPPDDRVRETLGGEDIPLWYYVLQEAATFGRRSSYPSAGLQHDGAGRWGVSHNGGEGLVKLASAHYGGEPDGPHYGDFDGGNTLGPVGGTLVGEVLTGLLEHYREVTGKGLDFTPEIGDPHGPGAYTMRDFIEEAGLAHDFER
jgi:hypothetical protein